MHKLPPLFDWATLDALRPPAAPEFANRVRSRAAVRLGEQATAALRVVLMGDPRTGKTSLAVAVGREAMRRRDVMGLYTTSFKLDKARREGRLGRGDAELVERALEVPVLVLDEFGGEDGASSAIAEIIHERHGERLQTLVVFALTMAEIRRRYSDGVIGRLLEGSVRLRTDREEQPRASEAPVDTLPPRAPWTPPAPRSAGFQVDDASPAGLQRAIESIGNGSLWRGPSPGPLRDVDYAEPAPETDIHEEDRP